MKNKNLILMALEDESCNYFDDQLVIYTGVGKVNSSYALTKSINDYKPQHIINLGSAGSTKFPTGSLVNCTQFIQRDMNVEPLGFPIYQTPFDPETSEPLAYGELVQSLPKGVCGSGDTFYTEGANTAFNVIDMEAYALAKICKRESVRFTCIKFITDGADGQAAKDWSNTLEYSAKELRRVYDSLENLE